MKKTEIAREIVEICKTDASFCRDLSGGDAEKFLRGISGQMGERDFLFAVEQYLASFGVRGHLYFYRKGDDRSIGFRLRRFQDSLFVTNSEKDTLLKGDEILKIDGASIPETAEKFPDFFFEAEDRQGEAWEKIISFSKELTVRRGGKCTSYPVKTGIERTKRPSFEAQKIDENTLLLRFFNFFDEMEMQSFLERNRVEIEHSRFLIFDVRENCGGSDTVFLPLLKYCLKEDDPLCGKPIFSSEEEILCTERNAQNRIKLYQSYLESSASEEVRRYLTERIEEQIENRGKGFVSMKEDNLFFAEQGTCLPEKVVVLTDDGCGSSGESFVQIFKKLDKVTVVGRPTMGFLDYSNLAYCDFGDYVLHYPTSRSRAIDEGKGMRGRGVLPDILIPWTPNHLFEDVDLLYTRRFLR